MSSGHNSDSTPSQHSRLDVVLKDRGLRQQVIDWTDPPPLETSSNAFMAAVKMITRGRNDDVLVPDENLNGLREVLRAEYRREADFDALFFKHLAELLEGHTITQNDADLIVLGDNTSTSASGFAVGFVRQKSVGLALFRQKQQGKTLGVAATESTITGMRSQSKVDHAVCLLSKDAAGNWNVLDCFAVVEFKLSHSSCEAFVVANGKVKDENISFDKQHKPLGQAIGYTIGCVYLYHARRGKLRVRDHNFLPIAMVAARKCKNQASGSSGKRNPHPSYSQDEYDEAKAEFWNHYDMDTLSEEFETLSWNGLSAAPSSTENDERNTCSWVSGRLSYPQVCGSFFHFSVGSFGGFFRKHSHEDNISVANALSLYFDTMRDGLTVARAVKGEVLSGLLPSPDPTSGLRLRLGGTRDLNLDLCASPIFGANPINEIGNQGWKIAQGDLFQGILNMAEIRQMLITRFLPPPPVAPSLMTDAHVLVKVSSTFAQNLLVSPVVTFEALRNIKDKHEDFPGALTVALQEIGTVLYGVFPTDLGLLTIMADLTQQGYEDVQPRQFFDQYHTLSPLWRGFANLVQHVLLPLAATAHVIHPDLRPGFDVTSNIMWALDPETTNLPVIIKLIDYESLVPVEKWCTDRLDGRYIKKPTDWTATQFVWWQCVTIAFVWKRRLLQSNVKDGQGMTELDDFYQSEWTWLRCLQHFANRTDAAGVTALLDFLEKWFDGTEEQYFVEFVQSNAT